LAEPEALEASVGPVALAGPAALGEWVALVASAERVELAGLAVFLLLDVLPSDWWGAASAAGKTRILDVQDWSLSYILTQPYALVTAVIGGAVFSIASHGTDQIIVQRLLTCRSLEDSRKALIGSAFIAMFQFALFLLVGLLLWRYYEGVEPSALGLTRGDEVFPKYIIEGLPPGLSGLLLAGILAAAMSTLSSSLNALASSTMLDLYERFRGKVDDERLALKISRLFTLFWGIVFIFFANLFEDRQNPVVELGLAIASFTYGALVGVFLLGLLNKRTNQADAIVAFVATAVLMVGVIWGIWYSADAGWVLVFYPSADQIADLGLRSIAWPWFTAIGGLLTLCIGSLSALRHT
jgi:Na+/proline symporter